MMEFDNPKVYYERYYSHKHNEKNRESEIPSDITYVQWKRQCECEIAKRGLQFHDMGHGWTHYAVALKAQQALATNGRDFCPAIIRVILPLAGRQQRTMQFRSRSGECSTPVFY